MNLRNVIILLAFLTGGFFTLSYAASVAGNLNSEHSYPMSVVMSYGKNHGDFQTVTLDREYSLNTGGKIAVQSGSIDVRVVQSASDQVTFALRGKFPKDFSIEKIIEVETTPDKTKFTVGSFSFDNEQILSFIVHGDETSLTIGIPAKAGEVKIASESGDIKVDALAAESLRIETDSGDIAMSASIAAKELIVKTDSGDVSAKGGSQSLKVFTDSGEISIAGMNPAAVLEAESDSGDLSLSFSGSPDALLKMLTDTGDISVSAKIAESLHEAQKVELKLGNGTGDIKLKTDSGDISVSVDQ